MDKTSPPKPSRSPAAPRNGAAAERAPTDAPQTLADIPNIGPIRVRALTKAGLDSLDLLRAASVEDLAAVPGITEIKARQIKEYLAQHPPTPAKKAAKAKTSTDRENPAAKAPNRKASAVEAEPEKTGKVEKSSLPPPADALAVEATQAASLASDLLTDARAGDFRPRLLRELTRFAPVAARLSFPDAGLSDKARDRAAKGLRQAIAELSEAIGSSDFDRKAQARLADTLAETTDKLASSGKH